MNSRQRRKARRQGKDVPYFDGFDSHEARMAHQRALLDAKDKRRGGGKGKRKQDKLDPLSEATRAGTVVDLLLSNRTIDDFTANELANLDGLTNQEDGYINDGYDGYIDEESK